MASVASHLPEIIYTHSFESPIGTLHAGVDRHGRVLYLGFRRLLGRFFNADCEENKYACGEVEYQLDEYFAGTRREFTVEVRMDGTGFQKAVWSRLMKIGYGETVSYAHVAQKIGRREAARAVGNAVAANRVLIMIPCHRVVPASGGIGGYARRTLDPESGRRVKHHLLDLESGQAPIDTSVTSSSE